MFNNLAFQCSNKSLSNNRFSFMVCGIHFNVIHFQKIFKRFIIKFTTLINPYFIWFSSFWNYYLKCINYTSSFFIFYRNNPCIFTKQLNTINTWFLYYIYSVIAYQLNPNPPNIVSKKWINFSFFKFSSNWFMKFIC